MSFQEAIRTNIVECLNFQGRAPRSAYWWYVLFVVAGSLIALVLDIVLFWPPLEDLPIFLAENFRSISDFYINVMPVLTFWYLLNYLPFLAVGVRRMHDCDRPGWWFVAVTIFVSVMSIITFQITGEETSDLMMTAFNPNASVEELTAVIERGQELNATSTILTGIQSLAGILIIIWMATKGTDGPNRYGEDPLA